jgi:uncharacterized membrane protein
LEVGERRSNLTSLGKTAALTARLQKLIERVRTIDLEAIEKVLSARILGRERGEILVYAAVILYTLTFSSFTILKHNLFHTLAWDLGIYNQSMWTTAFQGKLFYYTCELHYVPNGSFFGIHFAPILFLLLPFYALVPGPETLLVFQSLILALGAIPLYLLGKFKLSRSFGGAFAVSYLLYPALHGVNSYDFHVQAFFPVLILSCLYFLEKQNWVRYFLFMFLSLMVLEQAAYVIVFLGVYLIWKYKGRILTAIMRVKMDYNAFLIPLATIVAGLIWYVFAQSVIRSLNPSPPPELKAGQNFAVLGVDDPGNILFFVLKNPSRAFNALSFDFYEKFAFLMLIFGPVLLLPILSPSVLIATIPWLGVALVSNYPPYYRLGFQYPGLIIAFVFASAVFGLKKLLNQDLVYSKIAKRLQILLLVSALLFCLAASPLSPMIQGGYPSPAYIRPVVTDHINELSEIIRLIPQNESILTQDNIFAHVSNRGNAYVLMPQIRGETPMWQKEVNMALSQNTTYVLVDLELDPLTGAVLLENVTGREEYGLYASAYRILLFKRFYVGEPILDKPVRVRYDFIRLICNGEVLDDPNSVSKRVLFHNATSPSLDFFWYGPYDVLPPGNYTASFSLKMSSAVDKHVITLDVRAQRQVITSIGVSGSDFTDVNTWQNFKVQFELKKLVADIEFRGLNVSNAAGIYLDYIEVASSPLRVETEG